MKKISLHIFRVILLTIMLLNSLLASAAMPCKMDVPNQDSGLFSNLPSSIEVLDHSQHNMTDSDMAAMNMPAMNMPAMNMNDTSMDCCGNECPCEISCGSSIVLLDSESNLAELPSSHEISFYLSSIPNAVQGKIFHPPIQA